MADTLIEWAGKVWNVIRGCLPEDEGCAGCYAAEIAVRFSGPGLAFEGLGKRLANGRAAWTGAHRIIPHKLLEPLRWRKGERVFVNSVSDLWWEAFPDSLILAHLAIAYLAWHHRYLCLTKRAERLVGWLERHGDSEGGQAHLVFCAHALAAWLTHPQGERGAPGYEEMAERILLKMCASPYAEQWPPPNWLQGVSVASDKSVGRVAPLLESGFPCPWVSAEPLVGPVDLRPYLAGAGNTLAWVVPGGESGRRARPCALEWVEDLISQGRQAGLPVFVKQLGSFVVSEHRRLSQAEIEDFVASGMKREALHPDGWAWRAGVRHPKGGDPSAWPEHLRVRAYPPEAVPAPRGPRYPGGWPIEAPHPPQPPSQTH